MFLEDALNTIGKEVEKTITWLYGRVNKSVACKATAVLFAVPSRPGFFATINASLRGRTVVGTAGFVGLLLMTRQSRCRCRMANKNMSSKSPTRWRAFAAAIDGRSSDLEAKPDEKVKWGFPGQLLLCSSSRHGLWILLFVRAPVCALAKSLKVVWLCELDIFPKLISSF